MTHASVPFDKLGVFVASQGTQSRHRPGPVPSTGAPKACTTHTSSGMIDSMSILCIQNPIGSADFLGYVAGCRYRHTADPRWDNPV